MTTATDDDTPRELRASVADMGLQRNYWHREAERLRSALAAAPAPRGIPDPAYSDWYYITRTPALQQQRPKP